MRYQIKIQDIKPYGRRFVVVERQGREVHPICHEPTLEAARATIALLEG